MIKVRVLGSGGAFNTEMTNSSFLIEIDDEVILFDCGYNVFTKLRELETTEPDIIQSIDKVIISHMDDDHMGSVKSLIYYRFYVLGLRTTLIIDEKNAGYFDINTTYSASKYSYEYIVDIKSSKYDINSIRRVYGNHHITSFGVVMCDKEKHILAISGDTKANSDFEKAIKDTKRDLGVKDENILIFHDYSYWNAPSKNVHACQADYDIEYSDWFRNKAIKYHNNKNIIEDNVYITGNIK